MHAMPVMIGVLCVLAIAYRFYSAFIAARVATLDDSRPTPAHQFNDGQNFHPTNKWVLFGHHFAAISGAGPLIGPVLAAQFGYLPGLLWIVIGVCLAGAVQDFLVLVASMRRGGASLAQIAFKDVGKVAGTASTIAILFIIIIALAGLGKVVVKALGGETITIPATLSYAFNSSAPDHQAAPEVVYSIPTTQPSVRQDPWNHVSWQIPTPARTIQVPGSSWGTFTIACTIPIALLIGLYMYKIRPGRVVEASIIGGVLTIGATILGGFIWDTKFGHAFNLSAMGITWSMAIYGFVASVLPVWVLLCPRDYLSSFLKIGTIGLLVIGVIAANPKFEAPAINHAFLSGGPVLGATAKIFPFLFITVMCGAISGFHALVSSGTTPKMISKESQARTIGYGAMLIEGLVGCVAMIAAASLPTNDYYAMNTPLADAPKWHDRIVAVAGGNGIEHIGDYETMTQESLRGRTGGAVTLAIGMANIFDKAIPHVTGLVKYWYHFAIMFEALFILTTIDTGTRIGRFIFQEVAGKMIHPMLGIKGGVISAILSTGLVVLGWAWFMNSGPFDTVWKTFGIANQMLAVIALAIVSAYLVGAGKSKYLWVTVTPMLFVLMTTSTGAVEMIRTQVNTIQTQLAGKRDGVLIGNSIMIASLVGIMLICGGIVVIAAAHRILFGNSKDKTDAPKRGFETVLATD